MTKEIFYIAVLAGGLSGWIAVAAFYAVMHGVFGMRGERGADGAPGMQGPQGIRGEPGKCKCKCKSRTNYAP